jgi:hypothetical protein
MTKATRILALVAGALSMAALPCVPALASTEACRMPGCVSSPMAEVSPASCCCAVSNAPAVPGAPSTPADPLSPTPATAPAREADLLPAGAHPLRDVAVEPPAHVPLFLLHASLLI